APCQRAAPPGPHIRCTARARPSRLCLHPHTLAMADRRGGRRARPAACLARACELGHRPALSLSSALWRQRSGVRPRHRLLPVLAAGLYRAEDLAAGAADPERGARRRGLLGTRRHRARQAAAPLFARRRDPRLGAAWPVVRAEGVVLLSRSLS